MTLVDFFRGPKLPEDLPSNFELEVVGKTNQQINLDQQEHVAISTNQVTCNDNTLKKTQIQGKQNFYCRSFVLQILKDYIYR